jgi:hypothetical protein
VAESIFWDTWAFIALADQDYRYHQQAEAVSAELASQRSHMVTTEAVLTELGNAFSRQPARSLALRQLELVRQAANVGRGRIIAVDHALWERAWQLYQQRPDKDWGHTDRISFVVMQDLGLTQAFTADRHFEQAGFTCLVKP